jgi:hypothetical protein
MKYLQNKKINDPFIMTLYWLPAREYNMDATSENPFKLLHHKTHELSDSEVNAPNITVHIPSSEICCDEQ